MTEWEEFSKFAYDHDILPPDLVYKAFHKWTGMGPIIYGEGSVICQNEQEDRVLGFYLALIANGYIVPERVFSDQSLANKVVAFMSAALLLRPQGRISSRAIRDEKFRREAFLEKEVYLLK